MLALLAEEELEPLREVAGFSSGDDGGGGVVVVLGAGGIGVLGKIDEGFAWEDFVLVLAGSELLVLGGGVVFVFEFEGFDFEFEEGEFVAPVGDFLGERPVAGHGGNGAPSPSEAKSKRDQNHNIVKNKEIVFEPIAELAELGLDVAHAIYYSTLVGVGVEAGVDLFEMLVGDVGVDLGGGDVGVAEQGLDGAEVGAVHEKVGSEAVAEGVGGNMLGDAGGACVFLDDALNGAGGEAAEITGGVGLALAAAVAEEKRSEAVVASI